MKRTAVSSLGQRADPGRPSPDPARLRAAYGDETFCAR